MDEIPQDIKNKLEYLSEKTKTPIDELIYRLYLISDFEPECLSLKEDELKIRWAATILSRECCRRKSKRKKLHYPSYGKDDIKEKIATDDWFAVDCLMMLFNRELYVRFKGSSNGGFTNNDSGILSSFARQVEEWLLNDSNYFNFPLSDKQMGYLQQALPKYAPQLEEAFKKGQTSVYLTERKKTEKIVVKNSIDKWL